jgi:manganese/zinc/iron transport system substrate-binding protein
MVWKRRFLTGLISLCAAFAVAASWPAAAQSPLRVVATTGMIADAARQVGGDAVDVTGLMGPGVDPHAYRQTRTDIAAMSRADLVLWHGLYLEAQMEEFLLDLGKRRKVVAVAEAVPQELRLKHDAYENRFDPHVWMDPKLWMHVVTAVRDALTAARPESRAVFEANATRHLEEVARLAGYGQLILASVPAERRVLLTAHDAFKYFGRAYGFEVVGIQGISTESEAGLNRIGELVDFLVTRKIGAVFVETSVGDRNLRALIEGAASRGHHVVIGGSLFSDAMGNDGTYEGTYIGMIDHNITTIARALGGTPPGRGMAGRLAVGG